MNRMKNIKGSGAEWSRNGSLVNKPVRGWLHPDDRVIQGGVSYGVRYIGCIEIRQSMRTLPFELRAAVSKEAICRVVDEAGLRVPKKRKIKKDISKVLGDKINLGFVGSNINLTISVRSLQLIVMETGKVIANHLMQSISFASGGDGEVTDFVGYVAKDPINSRACHVLECQGGLAPDVITTIGQAFELRFKEHLKNPPKPVTVPDPLSENSFEDCESAWGDDHVYSNEIPGQSNERYQETGVSRTTVNLIDFDSDVDHSKSSTNENTDDFYTEADDPPDISSNHEAERTPTAPTLPPLSRATSDSPVSHPNLTDPPAGGVVDEPSVPSKGVRHTYENAPLLSLHQQTATQHPAVSSSAESLDHTPVPVIPPVKSTTPPPPPPTQPLLANSVTNPFSMESLQVSMISPPVGEIEEELHRQPWFHGLMTRKQSEEKLTSDGDFLVRESTTTKGQYVLSGMQNNNPKHLMLVDPHGKVRTKDKVFDSVSHLIHYHRDNDLPIISSGSIVRLIHPVPSKPTH